MQVYKNTKASGWSELIRRPVKDIKEMEEKVQLIIDTIKKDKDLAIHKYALEFDNVKLGSFEVSQVEKNEAANLLSEDLKASIRQAKNNIEKFHSAQREPEIIIETMPGVNCWRRSVPIQKVGLYVPGGSAPLFSTVLMLGVPASIAGCSQITVCTPPSKNGIIHPTILYAAELAGVHRIFKIGGIQAIAAMAYGTETVPPAYKIFGPGNQYVTVAKQLINREGVAIDMLAGPSEVLILADNTANPDFVAADLLAQAEHGSDSHCLLVTDSEELIGYVEQQIHLQMESSSRSEIIKQAMENCRIILVENMSDGVAFTNLYAPEHLIVATENPKVILKDIYNAGSVFLGNLTPVSVGDYASGTNHTLPTNGAAIAYSGVSLDSFIKKITCQQLTLEGLQNIGPVVQQMAEAEQLTAHSNAISVRLNYLQ